MVLKILYDIDVEDENDAYVGISEDALAGPVEGLVPGKFLVEFLPFLRHVPPWFPGATSQRLWERWMAAGERLKNVPFEHTKAKLVRHSPIPVLTGMLIVRSSARITEKQLSRSPQSYSVGWLEWAHFQGTRRRSLRTCVLSHSKVRLELRFVERVLRLIPFS